VTVTAPARRQRPRGLPAALRVAVALVAAVTVITVGLAGIFASAASARTFRGPETRVAASTAAAGQMVGAHQRVLAGQRRARAPSYDRTAVGSCVAAETEPDLSGCPTSGGLSFTAATPVLLADGSSKAISQLTTADTVLATNTTTGKTQAEPVAAVLVHHDTNLYDLTVRSGGVTSIIHTTANHLFWDQTTRSWTQAVKLHHGDHLQTPNHLVATVVAGATPAVTAGAMWDLTITADHDFYIDTTAAPVLVHNAGCGEDVSSFGNTSGPRGARLGDFGISSPDEVVGPYAPTSPLDEVPGASSFTDAGQSGLSGHYWTLPSGTELPDGIDIHADGADVGGDAPWGHRTFYPSQAMTFSEFQDLFQSLPWEYGGKV
jgi:hypothetical protein